MATQLSSPFRRSVVEDDLEVAIVLAGPSGFRYRNAAIEVCSELT
jgi:hypothetical protein